MKRGREYHCYGEKYNSEKRERGSNNFFHLILRLWEENQVGKKGKGTTLSEKSRFKNRVGKNIKMSVTLYTPV